MEKEKFTWGKLKEIVNAMPEELLTKSVCIWNEDGEGGVIVSDCEILEEDYHFNGDDACAPASIIMNEDYYKEEPDEYFIVHQKGTPILHAPLLAP